MAPPFHRRGILLPLLFIVVAILCWAALGNSEVGADTATGAVGLVVIIGATLSLGLISSVISYIHLVIGGFLQCTPRRLEALPFARALKD